MLVVKGVNAVVTFTHIWVIVDKFFKYTMFNPLKKGHTAKHQEDLYMEIICTIFDLLINIVTD